MTESLIPSSRIIVWAGPNDNENYFRNMLFDGNPYELDDCLPVGTTFDRNMIESWAVQQGYTIRFPYSKQLLIVRTDLYMKPGNLAAQIGHAAVGSYIVARDTPEPISKPLNYPMNKWALRHWESGSLHKICARVDSQEELQGIYNAASKAQLPAYLVEQHGYTQLNGTKTKTALGIGPVWDVDLMAIMSGLRML